MSASNGKSGFFKRASQWVKDVNEEIKAEEKAKKDAETTFYAEAAEKYGRLVASEVFDHHRIELYDGGYVRVGGRSNRRGGPTPRETHTMESLDVVIAYDTPFEKLRSIEATTQIQDKSAGGRAVASVASLGLSEMASNEKRIVFLTISTDQETYNLDAKGKMLRGSDKVALKLESTGQGILDDLKSRPAPATPVETPSMTDQLRDLAVLHREGALSDDEFARAKARLLEA